MFEIPLSFLYSLGKDGWNAFRDKKRSNSKRVEIRQKWKPQFESRIIENHRQRLRRDVYIRDLARLDDYPNSKVSESISASFRVGLGAATHRGILVWLMIHRLANHSDGEHWRYATPDEPGQNAALIGMIPYESIEEVDWQGDEFASFPHIYCRFDHAHEPYESLAYFTEEAGIHPSNPPWFREIATRQEVQSFSPRSVSDVNLLASLS